MEDYVSIIVAVISLVASLLAAALTACIGPFVTSSAKERKTRRKAEELFQKHRKKLFSAATNLQLPFLLETNESLDRFIDVIYEILAVSIRYEPGVEDSDLWMSSGAQMAISELMVEVGGSGGVGRICIVYSEFGRRWHASGGCEEDRDSMRYWFDPVVCGLQILI
ncbi:hypothetical protein KJ359_005012 [Pestalotiopsis sp. 9143b]|nr:hypothetical protein KJ359_005012 [Pestalotiopsis sp. 9143b]